MYILQKPVALMGFLISAFVPLFTPFLKVPIKGNWNLYQTDTSLFALTYGILAICVLFFFLRKVSVSRIMTWVYAGWCVLGFTAVFFKINNYFGFKFFDGMLAKSLHLKWGWVALYIGAAVLLFSTRHVKALAEKDAK